MRVGAPAPPPFVIRIRPVPYKNDGEEYFRKMTTTHLGTIDDAMACIKACVNRGNPAMQAPDKSKATQNTPFFGLYGENYIKLKARSAESEFSIGGRKLKAKS